MNAMESLMNSGLSRWRDEIVWIKVDIAANSGLLIRCSLLSQEPVSLQMPIHESIRPSYP